MINVIVICALIVIKNVNNIINIININVLIIVKKMIKLNYKNNVMIYKMILNIYKIKMMFYN